MSSISEKTGKGLSMLYNEETWCNGFGCNEKATEKINVDAGSFGRINLTLCQSCVKKF